jgi:hypothetical protein
VLRDPWENSFDKNWLRRVRSTTSALHNPSDNNTMADGSGIIANRRVSRPVSLPPALVAVTSK